MNVIKIYGGLGNQMFQYALGLAMEKAGTKVQYETSWFNHPQTPPRPYSLDKYGIAIETGSFLFQSTIHENGFIPDLLKRNNINLFGYWQYLSYYETVWNQVRKIFQVSEQYYTKKYLGLKERIIKNNSLSVHVRRGDYVTIPGHVVLPFLYYLEALELMPDAEEIFVFSDDIPWCKEKFKKSYFDIPITFVDVEEYLALDLMRLCKHKIIANSTYSWWAAMLSDNIFQKVIAPKIWRENPMEQVKMEDGSFIPNEWIRI